jgi:acyl-CoA thioesterase I
MKRLICHGDSLTLGPEMPVQATWPSLLANNLKMALINTGINGDTTGGMISRFFCQVVEKKPNIVVITGGTNDFWWDLPLNAAFANLFAMTCQAEYHGIAAVIGSPIPICLEKARGQDFMPPLGGYERCAEKLYHFQRGLAIRARDNHIPFIDFHRLFTNETGAVLPSCFLQDGLHANQEGHRRMAQKAEQVLRFDFPDYL